MSTQRTVLPLAPFGCAGSERYTVERVLHGEPGVVEVFVNPVTEMAYVDYDPLLTGPTELFDVLRRTGFAPGDRTAVRLARPARDRAWKW